MNSYEWIDNDRTIMIDKSWMLLPHAHGEYQKGIFLFMQNLRDNANGMTHFLCPCRKCRNNEWEPIDEIHSHLAHMGMWPSYTVWDKHGEAPVDRTNEQRRTQILEEGASSSVDGPAMNILHDAFPFHAGYEAHSVPDDPPFQYVVDDDYEKYNRLVEAANMPLCENSDMTVLDACLDAMQMKSEFGWTDRSMDAMCANIARMLPKGHKHPTDGAKMKSVIRDLAFGYELIDACEYNCVLFRKQYADLEACPKCNTPRWCTRESTRGKVPRKVLRYFPLTPRLKRLFMEPNIAKAMRWHGERVREAEWLKHPSDGEAWKEFNKTYPHFSEDVRNVRLALATDGFNPFGNQSTLHSTWPVIVMPYNLPPSLCMKKEFNMLALLIPGPKSPGKCLSVFMQPLIDELRHLWGTGVYTVDRYSRSTFTMKAAVLWTISDFPGLGMLVGAATKGYKACPICLDGTSATHEQGRMVYDGHRRWLPLNHPWRTDGMAFNGSEEHRTCPYAWNGEQILSQIDRYENYLSFHSFFTLFSLSFHFSYVCPMSFSLCFHLFQQDQLPRPQLAPCFQGPIQCD